MNLNGVNKTLEITCDAYSQGYEEQIVGYSGNKNDTDVK
jgi:hypothetical protein